ncbi:hypothetical protein PYW07_015976 [Mythimna separata]|uniref:Uncharacterized protein n=1 Tax=Mythimna separata TaxID=271217 RepID=A0AAD7YR29_MYTSE|nr:hypothetical protein PYW07_015976 [Mythimna separata]
MLFGTSVFMSRTFRGQWTSVILVLVLKLHFAFNSQIRHDNEQFDKNFEHFLRDLGSHVYKSKRTEVTENEVFTSNGTISTLPVKNYRRSQKFNTQKAILQDVLMMKLVSYYEDKYKLSHLEQTATEGISDPNADSSKTDALTKNNLYKYNVIDKDDIFNNNPIPTKKKPFESNRKQMYDMSEMDDYQVSDVVIF